MRMRDGRSDDVPKPMARVGPRPLIWHVMRYYAHFGHTDFILCLGYGARHIKDYFLNYQETESNDFVLHHGQVLLRSTDIQDWTIEFVDTGRDSAIGERLRRVREHVEDDEMFMANYADVLTAAPLDDMVRRFRVADAGASLLAVPPQSAFHCVEIGTESKVERIVSVHTMSIWENGGYFILRPEVFEHIPEGGDLVGDGLTELTKRGRMLAYPYRGFWHPADTVKERAVLEAAYDSGRCPWMLWEDHNDLAAERFPAVAGPAR